MLYHKSDSEKLMILYTFRMLSYNYLTLSTYSYNLPYCP